jgi:hypothetical protein
MPRFDVAHVLRDLHRAEMWSDIEQKCGALLRQGSSELARGVGIEAEVELVGPAEPGAL